MFKGLRNVNVLRLNLVLVVVAVGVQLLFIGLVVLLKGLTYITTMPFLWLSMLWSAIVSIIGCLIVSALIKRGQPERFVAWITETPDSH